MTTNEPFDDELLEVRRAAREAEQARWLPDQTPPSLERRAEDRALYRHGFAAGFLAGDDPELDATDGAHPAWWRGHDRAAAKFEELVEKLRAEIEALRGAAVERVTIGPRDDAGDLPFVAEGVFVVVARCPRCHRPHARDGEPSHAGKCRRRLAEQYGATAGDDHADCVRAARAGEP